MSLHVSSFVLGFGVNGFFGYDGVVSQVSEGLMEVRCSQRIEPAELLYGIAEQCESGEHQRALTIIYPYEGDLLRQIFRVRARHQRIGVVNPVVTGAYCGSEMMMGSLNKRIYLINQPYPLCPCIGPNFSLPTSDMLEFYRQAHPLLEAYYPEFVSLEEDSRGRLARALVFTSLASLPDEQPPVELQELLARFG